MNTRNQLICVWGGPIALLCFFLGSWPLAQFIPPWPPTTSAAEVAARYQENTLGIRLGMVVLMLGSGFLVPFAAAIATQLKRIEGRYPALAYAQLGGGIGVMVFLCVPALMYTVTAFRPDRAPELTLLLNDLAWICFVMPFAPAIIQNFAIGFAILSDKSAQPVFPRWVGFFNFWVGILFMPGGMITFFKAGPFAWNGLIAFWVPASIFGIWFMVMMPALIKAIKQQAASAEV